MRVLVLPPTRADGDAIEKLLSASGIAVARVLSMAELCAAIREGAGTAMLSEETLVAETAPLLEELSLQPVWSDFPLIVLSGSGRESPALARILDQLGNVSVVERPVRTSTLLSLIRSDLRARTRQYDLRQHLADRRAAELEREQLLESERAARSEAERASRMKEEFLATLSHELRTPLHAVLGWTEVLRRSAGVSPDVAKGLDTIERNARSQARIIEDLLDMSSIISGKLRLEIQAVDLGAIVRATAETVRPTAESKGVALQATVDPLAGTILGDPNRLQQILWNLLTNAVKFTPRGGRVMVMLERMGSQLVLQVLDNGEGIDPEFLPQVFDRFRQADASTGRGHGGLGLGLSIVKQLVELHGGMIVANSAGRGAGSCFTVSFPLTRDVGDIPESGNLLRLAARADATSVSAAGMDAANLRLEGLNVLVVDDELDSRALVKLVLEERGASVTLARSTNEALEAIGASAPDVLVSDIGMPDQDGYALIRQVRGLQGRSGQVPALALTAYARAEDRVRAIAAGYQAHLSKPVEPLKLVAAVCALHVDDGRKL